MSAGLLTSPRHSGPPQERRDASHGAAGPAPEWGAGRCARGPAGAGDCEPQDGPREPAAGCPNANPAAGTLRPFRQSFCREWAPSAYAPPKTSLGRKGPCEAACSGDRLPSPSHALTPSPRRARGRGWHAVCRGRAATGPTQQERGRLPPKTAARHKPICRAGKRAVEGHASVGLGAPGELGGRVAVLHPVRVRRSKSRSGGLSAPQAPLILALLPVVVAGRVSVVSGTWQCPAAPT